MTEMQGVQGEDGTGRVFEEKLSEKMPIPSGSGSPAAPLNQLRIDTQAGDPVRNSASEYSALRSPEGMMIPEVVGPQQVTRTLPAWVRSIEIEVDDDDEATVTDRLLPPQPNDALVAQHNHSPSTARRECSESRDQRLLGEDRSASQDRESRWITFSRAIQYPRETGREGNQVTPEWMDKNHGDYSQPWRGQLLDGDSPEYPLHTASRRRDAWFKRFHSSLLKSPVVPLILRLTVWCFSLSALALGGSIQKIADGLHRPQGPSALMAIIVDAVALVYLVYITFDEYTSKPLGLRSPTAKARLILLDLIFIVFDSANLSLAFASLSEVTGSCKVAEVNHKWVPKNDAICSRQKALASVLLVALLAWLMTFALSVLRLVERVAK
ncbi:hypothetical protein N7474_002134 [Penicillium riverlandense]|uniref:uncharacterized protein n=1 Tax=Penicillium riverlandense TaxID=1903569 RepID=UPI002548A0A5|nr:uncharacterized protein N7474_002134 [Penicillium riverlandense]KAJ5833823.1 hypothetical protein N7474_002134 [Penicillium riverlandense]